MWIVIVWKRTDSGITDWEHKYYGPFAGQDAAEEFATREFGDRRFSWEVVPLTDYNRQNLGA